MKVVILTAHTPNGQVQHRFVADFLARKFSDELVAIVVATGMAKPPAKRVRQLWKRYSIGQLASRLMLRARHGINGREERRQEIYRRILFPQGGGDRMPRPDIVHRLPSHNGAECLALLDRLRPDIVVSYGTLVLRPPVIAKARKSILNMHTGLSPRYRGSDTIFWAIHNGEPEHIGVTIHRVDPGIDSGAILATASPTITADDDEDSLFAKAVLTGAPLLAQAIIDEFEGTTSPSSQQLGAGREYRSVMRTVAAELRAERKIREGLLRNYAATKAANEAEFDAE